jgi:integrase
MKRKANPPNSHAQRSDTRKGDDKDTLSTREQRNLERGLESAIGYRTSKPRKRVAPKLNLIRNKDATYSLRHTLHGVRQTTNLGKHRRLRDAQKAARDHLARVHNEAPQRSPSWPDYCARYLSTDLLLLRNETQTSWRSIITKHLLEAFAGCEVHEVPDEAQSWVYDQIDQGVSPPTIRSRLTVLRAMLAHAVTLYGTPATPRLRVGKSSQPARPVPRFDPAEAFELIARSQFPAAALYGIGFWLGLRPAELVGVAWKHVDLEKGELTIAQQAQGGRMAATKTPTSVATLQIPDELTDLLVRYRSICAGELLAPSPRDPSRPMTTTTLRARLKRDCRAIGIAPRAPHAFRRTFSDSLIAAGAPLDVIRRALRHSSLETTVRYLREGTSEDVGRAIAKAAARHQRGNPGGAVVPFDRLKRRKPRKK